MPDGVYDHFAAGVGARGAEARRQWLPCLDHVHENIMTSAQGDVSVIGAGSAGVLAALHAADLGMRTVLVATGPICSIVREGHAERLKVDIGLLSFPNIRNQGKSMY